MNIFILDENIEQCARYHCDRHLGKMVLESTQILCAALNKKGFETPYRCTHVKHPSVLWVEQSHDNFLWLLALTSALNREFCWRHDRDKDQASIKVLRKIEGIKFDSAGLTPFPKAMPDIYKVEDDAVSACRAFYIGDMSRFASWKKRETPEWFLQGLKELF